MKKQHQPSIILVKPQLGENIGTAARAMYNGGLTDLRLVKPKFGWPNENALKPSAGAIEIIKNATVYETTKDAIEDLSLVLATTARPRDMIKRVYTPRKAAEEMLSYHNSENKIGVLFGPERTGLHNDDIALSDGVITVPLNPDYTSLNLAQAVLLIAYEWFQINDNSEEKQLSDGGRLQAEKKELIGFFEHLESELDNSGFLRVLHKRPVMVRNIRNMFLRADLTSQEVRTLRGIISDLVDPYYKVRKGNKK